MKLFLSNYNRFYRGILYVVLLALLLSYPQAGQASLAEDIISREGWRKISLDFEKASLINILKIFSQQSGLNFVASPQVSGKSVTLYLENVPLREALEKILNANKLTYELDENSNIFVVRELVEPEVELITKVYSLKYAQLSGSPINNASGTIHQGLVDSVRDRLSSYGKMNEDTRTNSLIITDVPFAMKEIEATIRSLDIPIPQVMIEVEIIDTAKNLVDDLGFNWNSAGSLFSYVLPMASLPGTTDFSLLSSTGSAISPAGGSSPGRMTFGGPWNSILSLSHLRTNSDTKILARPKILTLSNEQAEIKIAGKEVVSTTESKDSDGNVESISAEYEDDIGVSLTVTPSVSLETGEILMVIEPTVKSTEDSAFQDSNANVFKNINERSAKVKLVAKNNQTIVLGGLLRHDLNETKTKVPCLGDIPFLGALFRHKSKTKDQDREMLVFITPRIVDSSGAEFALSSAANYDTGVFAQREQADYSLRKEAIDKALGTWDN